MVCSFEVTLGATYAERGATAEPYQTKSPSVVAQENSAF
jgi:hypothetical protein